MSSPKVLKLFPGHAFVRGDSGSVAIMLLCKTIYPITYIHTCRQGCLAALELNCLVWVWCVLNWFQSSVVINTSGHDRIARVSYNIFTLLDSFPFFFSFPYLRFDLWTVMLASREDWHTPDPVHLAARPSQLRSGSQDPWCVSVNLTFLVTLEQKTCFGVNGVTFQALAMGDRNWVLFYRQRWKWFWRTASAAERISLGFWRSTMIKQASRYLCCIRSSFQFIVINIMVYTTQKLLCLNDTFFIDVTCSSWRVLRCFQKSF